MIDFPLLPNFILLFCGYNRGNRLFREKTVILLKRWLKMFCTNPLMLFSSFLAFL